jgi:hypothetical protein
VDSGLFNGLRRIQIKKTFPLSHCGANITDRRLSLPRSCRRLDRHEVRLYPVSRNRFSIYAAFPQENVQKSHGAREPSFETSALRSRGPGRRRRPLRLNTIALKAQIGGNALERTLHALLLETAISRPRQNVGVPGCFAVKDGQPQANDAPACDPRLCGAPCYGFMALCAGRQGKESLNRGRNGIHSNTG